MGAPALRVLMVDESPLDADMNCRALEVAGFQVTKDLVSSADQLVSRLHKHKYDVVLSDYSLRVWTGLDALRLVRKHSPATPFLIVADKMADDLAAECIKQGCLECIPKGHLDDLPEAVRNALLHHVDAPHHHDIAVRDAERGLAEREEILNQREQDFGVLGEMDDMLHLCASATHAYDVMAHFAGRIFGESSGLLRLLRLESGRLEPVAAWGQNPPSSGSYSVEACLALRTGGISGTFDCGPACSHSRPSNSSHSLCAMISGHGEILGLLEIVYSASREKSFVSNQSPTAFRRRAVIISEHFGRALTNLNVREALRCQSIRDPLTGLFNRRYLEGALEREVHRDLIVIAEQR